ncbi:Thivi_2564 family membrane protein [Mangrovibacterium sp.]|uniref:Thivi_2564 family membrane protein n=1 Tax=Mangrovibacterium sp. TaxID=1961364 RepID=UPI003564ABE6
MPILTVFIVILGVGVILWLVNSYIPMQRTIKGILNAVVVIILVIWLLKVFGVLSSMQNIQI